MADFVCPPALFSKQKLVLLSQNSITHPSALVLACSWWFLQTVSPVSTGRGIGRYAPETGHRVEPEL